MSELGDRIGTVSREVARLEQRHESLQHLLGEVLATLVVNHNRQTLQFDTVETDVKFTQWLEQWQTRFQELKS